MIYQTFNNVIENFRFGKYKGFSLEDVLRNDLTYVWSIQEHSLIKLEGNAFDTYRILKNEADRKFKDSYPKRNFQNPNVKGSHVYYSYDDLPDCEMSYIPGFGYD